jgi:hypothetical protein
MSGLAWRSHTSTKQLAGTSFDPEGLFLPNAPYIASTKIIISSETVASRSIDEEHAKELAAEMPSVEGIG